MIDETAARAQLITILDGMMAKSAERVQFLHDIMCIALEGGVGYWSVADEVIRHDDDDLFYARYTLYCFEDDDPKRPGECGLSTKENRVLLCQGHLIDPDAIARGMGLATGPDDADIGWHPSQRRHVIEANRENEAVDIDAGDADCIVQLAAFGKVIFG